VNFKLSVLQSALDNRGSKMLEINKIKEVGEDVRIHESASISRPHMVKIGNHVAIDEFFACSTSLEIADYVHISKHIGIIGGEKGLLKLGNFSNISLRGNIICVSDSFKGEGLISAPGIPEIFRDQLVAEPIIFEDFANTGANVTILPGVTLPEGVVIGACSLVRKSDELKPWKIYAGNPIRLICDRPKEKMLAYAKELGY